MCQLSNAQLFGILSDIHRTYRLACVFVWISSKKHVAILSKNERGPRNMIRNSTLAIGLIAAASTPAMAQQLPPGRGGEIIARACADCHGLEQIAATHQDANGWNEIVGRMIGNGAVLTDEDRQQVVSYLSANFGLTPAK
jgi:mono/diheme cytochrome c family protein